MLQRAYWTVFLDEGWVVQQWLHAHWRGGVHSKKLDASAFTVEAGITLVFSPGRKVKRLESAVLRCSSNSLGLLLPSTCPLEVSLTVMKMPLPLLVTFLLVYTASVVD